MGPKEEWIEHWMVGEDPGLERQVGRRLLRLFSDFWSVEELDRRAETTRRRYSASLHALGGYLVGEYLFEKDERRPVRELLREAVEPDEGPLLFQENEAWQRELDTTCRRLRRYLKAKG